MDTEQLIMKMTNEGAQKPLPQPMKQTVMWITGTFIYLGILTGYYGLRADIAGKFSDGLYMLELFLLFNMGVSAAMATFCLSRPDGHQKPWIKYLPFGFILPVVIVPFSGAMGDMSSDTLLHAMTLEQLDCPWHILLFSAPLGVALFLIVRMGATIQCCWAGTMATWSVTSFAYIFMRLIEQNDDPAHLISMHTLPITLICLAGMMIGKYALKWR